MFDNSGDLVMFIERVGILDLTDMAAFALAKHVYSQTPTDAVGVIYDMVPEHQAKRGTTTTDELVHEAYHRIKLAHELDLDPAPAPFKLGTIEVCTDGNNFRRPKGFYSPGDLADGPWENGGFHSPYEQCEGNFEIDQENLVGFFAEVMGIAPPTWMGSIALSAMWEREL